MALPLLFSFLGGGLAKAGVLGAAGSFLANPLVASAIGSGVGTLAETGDVRRALLGGLGSFAGGHLMGNMMGGAAAPVSTNAVSGPMAQSLIPPPRPEGLGQAAGAAAAGSPGMRGIFDAGLEFAQTGAGMGSALGGMAGGALGDMLGSRDRGAGGADGGGFPAVPPMQRQLATPDQGFVPGVSGEFDYGISAPYTSDYVERYAPQRRAMGGFVNNPYAQNYAQERGQMLAPVAGDPMMAFNQPMGMAAGGTVNRMVPGFGPVAMQAGGIADVGAMGDPMPSEQPNEREVISDAIAAISGRHPQPEMALGVFLQQYGEEALRNLVDRVQSGEFRDTQERFANGENGEVVGPGDGSGVDDMVPAVVDGEGDVLLSDGEFVVRKDATDSLNRAFGPEFMDRLNDAGARAPEVLRQMLA